MNTIRPWGTGLAICLLAFGSPMGAIQARPVGPGLLPGSWTSWVKVPGKGKQPGFTYRTSRFPQYFRFQVRPEPGTHLKNWALQVWFADPRVVALQQRLLKASTAALRATRAAQRERGHASEECQKTYVAFLKEAEDARERIQSFDPSYQEVFFFKPTTFPEAPSIPVTQLGRVSSKEGIPVFEGAFTVDRNLDLAGLDLPSLGFRAALVPSTAPRRRPLHGKAFTTMPLVPAWHMEDQLHQPAEVLASLWKREGGIYLHSDDGYVPGNPGFVWAPACFGAEGRLEAPDLWEPHTGIHEFDLPANLAVSYRIFAEGPRLLLLTKGDRHQFPRAINLGEHLSGGVEQGWNLLFAKEKGSDLFLLLTATSQSRPGSPSGYCGGGEEEDLVWLRIQGTSLAGMNTERIDSCFMSLQSLISPGPGAQGIWEWAFQYPAGKGADFDAPWPVRSVLFDPLRPDLGISIQESTFESWSQAHPAYGARGKAERRDR